MTLVPNNTLGGRPEPFAPADPDHVTLYVCGPTVYDHAHVGNARPAVVFDLERVRAWFAQARTDLADPTTPQGLRP